MNNMSKKIPILPIFFSTIVLFSLSLFSKEYSQFGEDIPFGDSTPRAGNDSGGGQPGRILKCKGWEKDPNAYTYFITQAAVWEKVCDVIGKPEWKEDENYSTVDADILKIVVDHKLNDDTKLRINYTDNDFSKFDGELKFNLLFLKKSL